MIWVLMSSTCPYCPLPLKEYRKGHLRATCGNESCANQYRLWLYVRRHASLRELAGKTELGCPICDVRMNEITPKHLATHGITLEEFRAAHPGATLTSGSTRAGRGKSAVLRASYSNAPEVNYDEDFHSFMTGTLLGDGSIERQKGKSGALKTARYAEGGSNDEYMMWKHNFLSKYFGCSFKRRTSKPHVRSGKCYTAWWLRTKAYPVLTELHSLWYPEGQKVVPFDYVMRFLNPLALSIWICDDGHRDQSGLQLYTMAFGAAENRFLAGLIAGRFNVQVNIRSDWKGKPTLYVRSAGVHRIDEIMRRFDIPGMAYKARPKKGGRIDKDTQGGRQ